MVLVWPAPGVHTQELCTMLPLLSRILLFWERISCLLRSNFERGKGCWPQPGSLFVQAALAERIGDSAQGENKQWLLIVQHLQKKTLSWGGLSLTSSGFLLLWLPGIVPGCARPQFCPPFSLTPMLSFLFWLLHYEVTYRYWVPADEIHSSQQLHPPFLTSFLLSLLPSTTTLSLSPPPCTVTTAR